MAIPPERIPDAAFQFFVRTVLQQLMVERCMAADDPIADAETRSKITLNAGDLSLEKRGGDDALSQHFLHQLETFWQSVRDEVEARVRFGKTR